MDKRRIIIFILIIVFFLIALYFSNLYYKNRIEISFYTGTNDEIISKFIKKGEKIDPPSIPINDGYIFKEWQYNGESFDFNQKIYNNITLTAKWIKEEYITISYVTNSNYDIDTYSILKGSNITNLPEAYKDGYTFIGWNLNGKLYENELVYSDTTLVASYEKNTYNEFNVGDKIIIIGSYSSSCNSEYSYHSKAIGWEREILYIFNGTNYPYMVGNEYGVTGFFNIDSIESVGE